MDIATLVAGAGVAGRLIHSIASSEESKSFVVKMFRKFKMRKCRYVTIVCEDSTRSELYIDVNDDKYVVLNIEKILLSMNSDDENMSIANLKVNNNDLYALQIYRQLKPILRALRMQYKNKTCVILISSVRLAQLLKIDKHLSTYLMTDRLFNSTVESLPDCERRFLNQMRKIHLPHLTADYDTIDELKRLLQRQFS
jgi:hypothetical protein